MTAPAGAFSIKAPVISFGGAATYTNQLTKARLVPDVNTRTMHTLVPDGVVADVDSPVWTLELAGIQDWKNGTGLCDYLNDNHGVTVTVVLQPKPGTGETTASFSIVSHAVEYGGEYGTFATFEDTFSVVGAPVFTVAP